MRARNHYNRLSRNIGLCSCLGVSRRRMGVCRTRGVRRWWRVAGISIVVAALGIRWGCKHVWILMWVVIARSVARSCCWIRRGTAAVVRCVSNSMTQLRRYRAVGVHWIRWPVVVWIETKRWIAVWTADWWVWENWIRRIVWAVPDVRGGHWLDGLIGKRRIRRGVHSCAGAGVHWVRWFAETSRCWGVTVGLWSDWTVDWVGWLAKTRGSRWMRVLGKRPERVWWFTWVVVRIWPWRLGTSRRRVIRSTCRLTAAGIVVVRIRPWWIGWIGVASIDFWHSRFAWWSWRSWEPWQINITKCVCVCLTNFWVEW